MDRDMNKYDLEHVTTAHAKMSPEELNRAYHAAWDTITATPMPRPSCDAPPRPAST